MKMGFMATMKAQKAYALHGKGDLEGAKKLYQEAVDKGLDNPRFLLSYAVLLIRGGEFQKGKDLLVKAQKAPGITAEQKVQVFADYAVCCYKLGDLNRGIDLLEKQHRHQASGLVYQTLGCLYVEKYVPENRPVAAAQTAETEETDAGDEQQPAALTQEQLDAQWQEGIEKALAFLKEAVEYDEEDSICLDNLGQFYYRVLGDKETAREWFDKAIEEKGNQIETLWFLSRYDVEKGDRDMAAARLEKALEGRFSPMNYCSKAMAEEELARLKK